jgi:hypothetical protein
VILDHQTLAAATTLLIAQSSVVAGLLLDGVLPTVDPEIVYDEPRKPQMALDGDSMSFVGR